MIPLSLLWQESNGAVAGDGAKLLMMSGSVLVINITSEGNLFNSFCNPVAVTASFHNSAVTALFLFFIQLVLFLANLNLFASLLVLFVVSTIL